jgi:signal transduction histidine kinase
MLHSIRFRLLLTVGVVVAAALAAVAVVTSRVTRQEFGHFAALRLDVCDSTTEIEAGSRVEAYFRRHGSLDGSHAVLQELKARSPQVRGFVVVDLTGRVAGASTPDLLRELPMPHGDSMVIVTRGIRGSPDPAVLRSLCDSLTARRSGSGEPVCLSPRTVPRLLYGDSGQAIGRIITLVDSLAPRREEKRFLYSVNRWLWAAVLGAGLLALGSTFLLARRILRPVEELTSIARQMGRGDLSRRASVAAKDEIGELARTFNGMADGLARIERLRRSMVEDVAHELRTPLTNIRCQLEAVQDGLAPPDRGLIDSLHEEVMALSLLVENLQDLALAEAGQLRLSPEPLSLPSEVERLLRSRPLPEGGAAAEIRTDLPPGLPAVLADPKRFRQILRNLLDNALTFTPAAGAITIGARVLPPPSSATPPVPPMVEIGVADTGPGIAPEDLPFIFERFYRADPSRQRATGGAGLGLAIVKQLVEAQGGRIRVESAPGQGARFLFTLPQGNPPPTAADPGGARPPAA